MYSGKGDEMRILVFSLAMLVLCSLPAQAAVSASQGYAVKSPYQTGYFGGLKPGNIFKLRLSLRGGVVFYRINPDKAASYASIPFNAPVRIQVDQGVVTSIEVTGGASE